MRFNPPPNWPMPPTGWTPERDWEPDPNWGPAPVDWPLWVQEQSSNWFARHKVLTGVGGAFVALLLLCGVIGSLSDSSSNRDTVQVAATGRVADKAAADKAAADKAAAAPAETVSQENARETAKSYLRHSSFSRKGLIEQLEFEGFSNKDATYGVDKQNADWNAQAVGSAKSYLSHSSFSRSGLIEQLEFEGFTATQAAYGVSQTGL
jgi:uncharacterized iron-regulated membrane protein